MKRNLFKVGECHATWAAVFAVAACSLMPCVAAAQYTANKLPTGDDVVAVMTDSEPPVASEGEAVAHGDMPSALERLFVMSGMQRLSSRYGVRRDPINGEQRMHMGVDVPLPHGTPVHATEGGVVTFAGWANGYGNMVEIAHGSALRTRYAHLSSIDVSRSGVVAAGQQIGRVGSTGRSTGSHLHYELRVNGRAVDPLSRAAFVAGKSLTLVLSPWIAPEAPAASLRQLWSDPSRDGLLPQPIIK